MNHGELYECHVHSVFCMCMRVCKRVGLCVCGCKVTGFFVLVFNILRNVKLSLNPLHFAHSHKHSIESTSLYSYTQRVAGWQYLVWVYMCVLYKSTILLVVVLMYRRT